MTPPRILALAAMMTGHSAIAHALPDLVIADMTVDEQCRAIITVKNLGPGALPPSAMHAGSDPKLQFSRSGGGSGGWTMAHAELVPAGGTYVHTVNALNLRVDGEGSFTATIDDADLVNEANETNNSLTRTLSCVVTKPDLTLAAVEIDNDCRARLTIRNVGKANLGTTQHGYTLVYREIDGVSKGTIRLSDMDPSRQAASAGGSVTWTDWAEFKPTSNARYRIAVSSESDANTDNNEGQVTVPDRCKSGSSAAPAIRQIIRPKLPSPVIPRQ